MLSYFTLFLFFGLGTSRMQGIFGLPPNPPEGGYLFLYYPLRRRSGSLRLKGHFTYYGYSFTQGKQEKP
jgi:hypothetical protein